MNNLVKTEEELKQKYGAKFLDEDYGWAVEIFNQSKRVKLSDIEDRVGLTRYRPFYIWASEKTHPNFGSMLDFFSENKLDLVPIVRPSLERNSYIDPMQFTLSLLHEINLEFLKMYSDKSEYDVNMLMFREIFDSLLNSFDELDQKGDNP